MEVDSVSDVGDKRCKQVVDPNASQSSPAWSPKLSTFHRGRPRGTVLVKELEVGDRPPPQPYIEHRK